MSRIVVIIFFVVALFIALLAGLIGVGYVLTRLLPLSLFEATLLIYLVGGALVYGFYQLFRVSREVAREAEEETEAQPEPKAAASEDQEVWRFLETALEVKNLPIQKVIPSPQGLNWATFVHYQLADDIWHELSIYPDLEDLPETTLQTFALALAEGLVTMLRTRPSLHTSWRVTRRDLRPYLMRDSLPQGVLEHLGIFVDVANRVLTRRQELLQVIAAHEQWPETASKEK